MRAQINLASEPFRRDRRVIVAASAASAALTVLLLVFLGIWWSDRVSMQSSLAQLERLEAQRSALMREQAHLEAELHQTGNADVLERSIFINELLYRKGISWTRIFEDLGTVLPPDVRVISIRPQVNSRNHVTLDMVVGAKTPQPVLELLAKFEGSDLFGAEQVSGILPPSQTDPLFRYHVTVNYAQKL